MTIHVKYFALLREAVGVGEERLELAGASSVGEVRAKLVALHPQAFGEVKRIRAAVNGVMARDESPVADGDEVAFFPPVTGG
ncbi:MAG: molybdopterin converting factor subunit 1 [Duodenibacillus sp.]